MRDWPVFVSRLSPRSLRATPRRQPQEEPLADGYRGRELSLRMQQSRDRRDRRLIGDADYCYTERILMIEA